MGNLSADVRLRPIRFGFLVRPDDANRVTEICRVNTCLWGGKFNPLIPRLKTVPKWWDRHGHRFETATQIVNGYLDFFEPDFLVESEPGLADGLGFDPERVVALPDMLSREGQQDRNGHGQNVFSLYRDLYRKEFQFARRHEHDIVDVHAEDAAFAGAVACLFGAFPEDQDLQYFRRAFTEAFEPKAVALNAPTLATLYDSGFTSAIRLGHSGIEIDTHGWHDPALFVFDGREGRDLIDFWNLRAVRRNVLPIPMQWLSELSSFCKGFISRNFRPLPGNPHGVMTRVEVMFSRSIPSDAIEALYAEHLRVDINGANVRQDWYPSLWQPSPSFTMREMRPTLIAARKTFNTPSTAGETAVHFDCLHPEFAEEYGVHHRWANVVRLQDWTGTDAAATVFPCDYRNPFVPRFRALGGEHTLPTTEGIVIFPRFKNIPEHWTMPDGATAIGQWLKKNNVDSVPSDAGRATQQIVQTLGGFARVGDLANRDIVNILNDMSRRPITRSAHHQEFRNRIRNAVKSDIWHPHSFEALVERSAVELGLEVRCANCHSWSWYTLKQLDYRLTCALCLREFGFPITDPGQSDHARWSYRVIGPFALPDYARGGYAAALAMRFFSEIIGDHDDALTWSAGQELTLGPTEKVEADFILWYQRKAMFGQDYPTDIAFGQAKSFGREVFEPGDIEKMKRLAQRFPGATLVLATMKQPQELSTAEVKSISKLALWGREYVDKQRKSRAPVIVLTGTELFAPFSLRDAWKQAGGRHAQVAEVAYYRTDNLRVLADLTQQLYLNLPPYSNWHQAKWEAIHARRKARRQIPGETSGAAETG